MLWSVQQWLVAPSSLKKLNSVMKLEYVKSRNKGRLDGAVQCPCSVRGSWAGCPLEVPSNSNDSTIL